MDSAKKFVTGNQYRGYYGSATNTMEGFGVYTYSDGSEYRGYFKNGRFDGFGRLKLVANNTFILKGRFCDGDILDVDEIIFSDGLRCKADLIGNEISLDKWRYLSENDRRYSTEVNDGLEPVGPMSYITSERPPKNIPLYSYDTGEGIFNPRTGFLTNIPKPFPPDRYIPTKKEQKWIRSNCRRGRGFAQDKLKNSEVLEPPPDVIRGILKKNVEAMRKIPGLLMDSGCNEPMAKKDYFSKLCQKIKTGSAQKCDVDNMVGILSTPWSCSPASFSEASLLQDVDGNRKLEDKLKIYAEESDESILMDYRVSVVYATEKDLPIYKMPLFKSLAHVRV